MKIAGRSHPIQWSSHRRLSPEKSRKSDRGKITRNKWEKEKRGLCAGTEGTQRSALPLTSHGGKSLTLGKGPSWGTRNSIIEYIPYLSNICHYLFKFSGKLSVEHLSKM